MRQINNYILEKLHIDKDFKNDQTIVYIFGPVKDIKSISEGSFIKYDAYKTLDDALDAYEEDKKNRSSIYKYPALFARCPYGNAEKVERLVVKHSNQLKWDAKEYNEYQENLAKLDAKVYINVPELVDKRKKGEKYKDAEDK